VSGEITIRHGIVSEEILREAAEHDYDLLVIGARAEMSLLTELLMEKVTPQIVEHALHSVLVVREGS
jgi:nucleotide-binding universal stress UspA family protein